MIFLKIPIFTNPTMTNMAKKQFSFTNPTMTNIPLQRFPAKPNVSLETHFSQKSIFLHGCFNCSRTATPISFNS